MAREVQAKLRGGELPLVGRIEEWGRLEAMLDGARRGRGGLALIAGEPGAGKSYLAARLGEVARARGQWVFFGRCRDGEGGSPYGPYVDILEAALRTYPDQVSFLRAAGDAADAVVRLLPRLKALVPGAPQAPSLPAEQDREYTLTKLAELIEPAAAMAPLYLVVEDLQWADEPTVQVVERLAPRLQRLPVLIVATYREREVDARHPLARTLDELRRLGLAERLNLKPFTKEDVAELLGQLGGGEPPPDLARRLHEHTGGNPFFVQELYLHLVESGTLDPDRADVPQSLKLAIGRRLERLPAETLSALEAAAVIGTTFTTSLLAGVLEKAPEDVLAVLEPAEAASVLRAGFDAPAPGYVFWHGLIRHAVLARLTLAARQRLHLRIARALEAARLDTLDDRAAAVAHHFFSAGDLADRKSRVRHLRHAGDRALAVAAYEEAHTHFERALLVREPALPEPDLYAGLGLAQRALGRWEDALRSWERAMDECGHAQEAAAEGRHALMAAQQLAWEGRWLDSLNFAGRGLQAIGGADDRTRARLLVMFEVIQSLAGNRPGARAAAEEARRLAGPNADDELLGFLGFAETLQHFCYLDHRAAIDSGLAAAERLRRANDLWDLAGLYPFIHWSCIVLGRFAEADRILAEAEPLAWRLGHWVAAGLLDRAKRQADFRAQGHLQTARGFAEEALKTLRRQGGSLLIADRLAWLAQLAFWSGDWEVALRRFEEATAEEPAGAMGGNWGLLAACRAYRGETGEMHRLLESRGAEIPRPGERPTRAGHRVLWAVAEALHVAGEREAAGELYPQILESVRLGQLFTFYSHRLLELLAALTAHDAGLLDQARSHFEMALRTADELPVQVERAEVRRHYAAALLEAWPAEGDLARVLLEQAAEIYAEIGMPRHLELAERALAALGEPAPQRAGAGETCRLLRSGDHWLLERAGRSHQLPGSPGLALLAELLRHAGSPVHVLDLLSVVDGAAGPSPSAREVDRLGLVREQAAIELGPDRQALADYRRRLEELAAEIREAEDANDPVRKEALKAEFDFIARDLERQFGLGGRRRVAGSVQERARTRVAKAIARALQRIEAADPDLGRHLRQGVSTGTTCEYSPDPLLPIRWVV